MIKPINIVLQIGDNYYDEVNGEGIVSSVFNDHYEIKFLNKIKLISKWSEDLSIIDKNIEKEKSFESDRDIFLTIPLQVTVFPKRVKLLLEKANIKTHGQLLEVSEDEIKKLALSFEEIKQQHIINYILKERKKAIDFLKRLEKDYLNGHKSRIYHMTKEEKQLQKSRDDFIAKHKNDWKDYYEELTYENGISKYVYKKKNNLTYKLRVEINENYVKKYFLHMLEYSTLDECWKYCHSVSDFYNAFKAYTLLNIGKNLHEKKHYTIQKAIQKKLQKLPKEIQKYITKPELDFEFSNCYYDFISCSLLDFKERFEFLFKDGMSWNNYGEWQIDHIKPCTYFDLLLPEQQKECFKISNLQPLWANENEEKSTNYNGQNIINIRERVKYCIFDNSITIDDFYEQLNSIFEKEHPPTFYDYL